MTFITSFAWLPPAAAQVLPQHHFFYEVDSGNTFHFYRTGPLGASLEFISSGLNLFAPVQWTFAGMGRVHNTVDEVVIVALNPQRNSKGNAVVFSHTFQPVSGGLIQSGWHGNSRTLSNLHITAMTAWSQEEILLITADYRFYVLTLSGALHGPLNTTPLLDPRNHVSLGRVVAMGRSDANTLGLVTEDLQLFQFDLTNPASPKLKIHIDGKSEWDTLQAGQYQGNSALEAAFSDDHAWVHVVSTSIGRTHVQNHQAVQFTMNPSSRIRRGRVHTPILNNIIIEPDGKILTALGNGEVRYLENFAIHEFPSGRMLYDVAASHLNAAKARLASNSRTHYGFFPQQFFLNSQPFLHTRASSSGLGHLFGSSSSAASRSATPVGPMPLSAEEYRQHLIKQQNAQIVQSGGTDWDGMQKITLRRLTAWLSQAAPFGYLGSAITKDHPPLDSKNFLNRLRGFYLLVRAGALVADSGHEETEIKDTSLQTFWSVVDEILSKERATYNATRGCSQQLTKP